MNKDNAVSTAFNTPFIAHRADPYIMKKDGKYYFTASVPEYDRIVLRCADTLEGLRTAQEHEIFHAYASGEKSENLWAPELHYLFGSWYVYYAAGEKGEDWKIRPWVIKCTGDDPMRDPWVDAGQVKPVDLFTFRDFSLDMSILEHRGRAFCVWAEKVSVGKKISNLYIAELASPVEMKTPQMLLTSPTYAWERHGFWVNEAPAFIKGEGKICMTFSASDTSAAYCMGMLWMDENDDPMDISAWHKINHPVLVTDVEKGLYGPGHNSFFEDDTGRQLTAYHARKYDEIIGDPLYDPGRNAYIMKVEWKDGLPHFDYNNQLYQD